MNKIKQIICIGLVFSGCVSAQQDGLPMGSFTVFPTFGFGYGYDDNVTLSNDGGDKFSSEFTTFSPGIRLESEGEKTDFMAQYDYNKTLVNVDSRYDFDMHHVLATLGHNASSRSRVSATAEYFDGSDRIGTGNQQGGLVDLGLDPDEWHSIGLVGKGHYGGLGAKGSIDVVLGGVDRTYDNNRLFTATRDRDTRYIAATYAHQISPKTNYLVQAKYASIDYDNATLDSTETRLMFGAEWQATGKTSARALVGYLVKDFDDPLHDDYSGLAIEAGGTWNLRSYSILDLTLSRETDETNGNGSYIVNNTVDMGWTHYWNNSLSTTANIGYSDENYEGSLREDTSNYYGLSAKYQFSDWLMSGLGYKHYKRDSSLDDFSYSDDAVLFTLELSK